jgi:hypothetical protein
MSGRRVRHIEISLTKFFDAAVLTVCSISLASIVAVLI